MIDALKREWSIATEDVEYVPKGVGSYHWRATDTSASYFVTVDDLDTKPWIPGDRDMTFDGLVAAYETALALHDDVELAAVVPPLSTTDGGVSSRLDAQYAITVFPFVDGVAGEWGRPIAAADRSELLTALAGLHGTPIGDRLPIRRRDNTLPERSRLTDALDNLSHPWRGGHHAEGVRELLAENAGQIRERLHRFEELAAQLDRAARPLVVTHGEPHPGNLIHTQAGLRLIDWDTVALAEPERDLWMLCGAGDDLDVDRDAVEFYELMWTLSDITSFTDTFRHQNPHPAWVEQKWEGFVMLLKGGSTMPYGPRPAGRREVS